MCEQQMPCCVQILLSGRMALIARLHSSASPGHLSAHAIRSTQSRFLGSPLTLMQPSPR
jgi:hypothetical protein